MQNISNISSAVAKKALVLISFGTTVAETRRLTIAAVEQQTQAAFPDYTVCRAFTSRQVIATLRERDGLVVDTPAQALQKLQHEEYTDVIVQPLLLLPAEEFHVKIIAALAAFRGVFPQLHVGWPLLALTDDLHAVADAISQQFPALGAQEAVVLMGHGTRHPANAAYCALAYIFDDRAQGTFLVGTVEGYPELSHVIKQLRQRQIRHVTLLPLMLVAGDHARNDMAGAGADSWRNRLVEAGLTVTVKMQGLGENPAIQAIYLRHIRRAIAGNSAANFSAAVAC